MYNKQTQTESADPQPNDSTCLAYGRKVQELLSASSADTWCDHLWEIYGGFMLAQPELGYNPRSAEIFWSFRDLLFFFDSFRENKRADG